MIIHGILDRADWVSQKKNPRKLHTFPTTGWLAITAGTVTDVCSKTNVYAATESKKKKKKKFFLKINK